jgi:hypothetical protein
MKERFAAGGAKEEQKKQTGIDRRSFLAGMATSAAAIASGPVGYESMLRIPDFVVWAKERGRRMKFDRWNTLTPGEREERIMQEVEQAKAFIQSAEGKRILDAGSDDEIFALISSLPALLRSHLTGTSFEIPKEKWPSVAVGFSSYDGMPFALGVQYGKEAIQRLYRGNGVFISPDTLLTNWHVFDPNKRQLQPMQGAFSYAKGAVPPQALFEMEGIDATFIHFGKAVTFENESSVPNVCNLSPNVHDSDVTGNLTMVAGLDPDKSAADDGTKVYPSIALPVTKQLGGFLERHANLGSFHRKIAANSFMYIAPPGESIFRKADPRSGSRALDALRGIVPVESTLMHGMSGSPVLMGGTLVGINNMVAEIEYQGTELDIGFFHGPDALHRAEKLTMKFDVSAPSADSSYSDSYEGGGDQKRQRAQHKGNSRPPQGQKRLHH